MTGVLAAFGLQSRRHNLPLILLAVLITCSAAAAILVAADLDDLARGRDVSETRTGPLVAAVEKTRAENRRPTPAPAREADAPSADPAATRRGATMLMLFGSDQGWGDMLLRK